MLVLLLIIVNIQHSLPLLQLFGNVQCLHTSIAGVQQANMSVVFCTEANLYLTMLFDWQHLLNNYRICFLSIL